MILCLMFQSSITKLFDRIHGLVDMLSNSGYLAVVSSISGTVKKKIVYSGSVEETKN